MNHVEAEATEAIGRYLLGEMDEDEETDFEKHYFECVDCAEEVRISTVFLANLRAVLMEPSSSPAENRGAKVIEMPRRRWLEAAGLAASVVLAVGLGYQNLVQIPQMRQEIQAANAEDSPPTYYLAETRAAEDTIALPAGTRHFALLLNQTPGRIYPFYDCELLDERGKTARAFRVAVAPNQEEWQLRLPAAGLGSQPYTLKVRGTSTATGTNLTDVAEYHFRLELR
jgi:hypothetical protein